MKMDMIRKVTPRFNSEFDNWMRKTKIKNGMALRTDKNHKYLRKAKFDVLAELIRTAPPLAIQRTHNAKTRMRYHIRLGGERYEGLL